MQLSEGNFGNLRDYFLSKSQGEDPHFRYANEYKFLSSLQICKFAIQTFHTLSFKGKYNLWKQMYYCMKFKMN